MLNKNSIRRLPKLAGALLLVAAHVISLPAGAAGPDTPLLSGMPSYKVEKGQVEDFGNLKGSTYYCAPAVICDSKVAGFDAQGRLIVEGRVSTYRYETEGNGSALAVERNYTNAVKSLGGRKVNFQSNLYDKHVYLVEKAGRRTWIVLENYGDKAYTLSYLEEKAMQQGVTPTGGGPDQPLLSGLPSYTVEKGKVQDFGNFGGGGFNCGPHTVCTSAVPGFNDQGKLIAEGKVSLFSYHTEGNGSELSIERNYHNAVKSLGGRKLNFQDSLNSEHVYFVEKGGRRTWIVLEIFTGQAYNLTYIEEKAMAQGVTVNELADAIGKKGYATVHLNFDNNSAVIKADSAPTVREIVKLLADDKSLRLSIEGHTDNVGNAAANKALSKARAESVVKALVQAKVDAKRLEAKGFGSEVSVADNRSDEGRAMNRRVELVKLK
jgi:OOP family OmpA-OmpF porin